MVVGSAECRAALMASLQELGYQFVEAEDPYAAMAEICPRPLAYRALILSLSSVYREELRVISSLKGRFPHLEIWLGQTDGRAAVLAEATGLGADGLLAEDGLHRFATSPGGNGASPPGNHASPPPPAGRISQEARPPAAEPSRSVPAASMPGPASGMSSATPPPRPVRTPPLSQREFGPRSEPPAQAPRPLPPAPEASIAGTEERTSFEEDLGLPEPVLTADELRALLQEHPTRPPASEEP